MMNNQHPVDLLPGYALSILEDGDAAHVRAHVLECVECQRELQQIVHELGDASQSMPRTRVRRQLFAHINFDMDMREALREGARRTSLRWIWGAFLLITGSLVASLLMWSGMQQREQLATTREATVVAGTRFDTALVEFLAQPGVTSHDFVAKTSKSASSMRLYRNPRTNDVVFVAYGLSYRTHYSVWLIDDIGATHLGAIMPNSDGGAWLRAQVTSMCIRCNVVVTQERNDAPTEPSNEWVFELIFPRD